MRGIDAHILAGGRAYEVLHGGQHVHPSDVLLPGPKALLSLPRYIRHATEQLLALQAQAVVSDGHAPGVFAARRLGLPVIALGHDVIFQLFTPKVHSLAPVVKQRINAWHLQFADAWVGAHFLDQPSVPPSIRTHRPIEVGRPMLSGLDPRLSEDLGHLVFYVREPAMCSALQAFARVPLRQLYFGPQEAAPPWMERGITHKPDFVRALHGARAVIGSAGSNLIAEAVALGKPLYLLHHPGEAEQALNAAWITRAGLGVGYPLKRCTQETVELFLERVNLGAFRRFDLLQRLEPAVELVERRLRALVH